MDLLIVSGLSGAGKSVAMNALEDIGFFCIDNVPAELLPSITAFSKAGDNQLKRVALSMDVRGCHTSEQIEQALHQLDEQGVEYEILFIDAPDDVLMRRYSETRRRHPLMKQADSLEKAVLEERDMMAPLRQRADYIIDTTHLSTAQLRGELLRNFGSGTAEKEGMSVSVTSFGFKHGLPMEADLVFDVRFMPNPYYIQELREKTGLDREVSDYVFSFQQTHDYMAKLRDLLAFTLPLYAEEGKTELVIAVGCTGGHHRSVAVTHALAGDIRDLGYRVRENHRDMNR